jgi:hypothetical protein
MEGIIFNRIKDELYAGLITFYCLTTFIVSVIFMMISNAIIFLLLSMLILNAYFRGELKWDLKNIDPFNFIFGLTGLIFGFWYLNWVKEPIFLNALFLSPLGILGSPTLLVVCGFICLSKEPRSQKLVIAVIIASFWVSLTMIIRFGIFFDIILVVITLFLLVKTVKFFRSRDPSNKKSNSTKNIQE